MNIIINEANMNDKNGIKEVFADENKYHVVLQPKVFNIINEDKIIPHGWLEEIISDKNKKIFVAKQEDKILGLCIISVMESQDDPLFKKRKWINVEEISVLSQNRGEGIGSKLMEYIMEYGNKCNVDSICLEVWSNNKTAINFYKKFGFETTKQIMWKNLE